MKEVMAVIRMNMMNKTKRALADAGITSMYAKDCLGRGKGRIEIPRYIAGGAERYGDMIDELNITGRMVPKRMITIVVPDKLVKTVITTIIDINKTGSSGDGKIFVLPVEDAWRVRSKESGDDVLDM